jgi:hypothetical protein
MNERKSATGGTRVARLRLSGVLTGREFSPLPPQPQHLELWIPLAEAAVAYWQGLAGEKQISIELSDISSRNADVVQKLKARLE